MVVVVPAAVAAAVKVVEADMRSDLSQRMLSFAAWVCCQRAGAV
uniref:Uncharacterized protein n=1 Tax=Magnetococcus massalia (strain MO-1) TaxID=451514 RepID=A0A1S7LMN5_MAGMO|nr:protein of unknown function [Candidatus Magnetococcus massalia]